MGVARLSFFLRPKVFFFFFFSRHPRVSRGVCKASGWGWGRGKSLRLRHVQSASGSLAHRFGISKGSKRKLGKYPGIVLVRFFGSSSSLC